LYSINAAENRRNGPNRFLITGLLGWLSFFALVESSAKFSYGQENTDISQVNGTTSTTPNLTNTTELTIGNMSYPIRYGITGDNQLEGIRPQRDNITLLAEISSVSNGVLTLELPRNMIDSKKQGSMDDTYAVFVDGQFVPYDEIMNNTQARTLRIDFGNGSEQIEISGTHIVPEFGPLAALVLAISMGSVVVVTRLKYINGLKDFFRQGKI
jgi:predicted secreted protein with PEFG-CTERM motif